MSNQPFWDSPRGAYFQLVPDLGQGSLWDTCTLGGRQLPGIVRCEGEPGRKWDVKTGPGTDGATITDQGFEPAKPTITVTIWTPAQWLELQDILAALVPRPGKSATKSPPAVPITHPALNAVGIDKVLILSVASLKPGSVRGTMEQSIKCIQWLKPKKAIVGPVDLTIGTTAAVEAKSLPVPAAPSAPSKGGGAGP